MKKDTVIKKLNFYLLINLVSIFFILLVINIGNAQEQIIDQDNTENEQPINADELPDADTPPEPKNVTEQDSKEKNIVKELLKSIMMNKEEEQNVNLAIESFKTGTDFLLIDENEEIEAKDSDQAEKEKKEEDNKNAFLYLSSIIFRNKNEWAAWFNDQKITSVENNSNNEIFVKNINFNSVDVVWKMSLSKWKILSRVNDDALAPNINEQNQVVLDFTLKTNQTYALKSGKVIEGRIKINNNLSAD